MHVAELWRYPVKSLRGELLQEAEVSEDRHSRRPRNRGGFGRAQAHHHLAHPSPPAGTAGRHFARYARGHDQRHSVGRSRGRRIGRSRPSASRCELIHLPGTERFDVLPLLVATDGAIAGDGRGSPAISSQHPHRRSRRPGRAAVGREADPASAKSKSTPRNCGRVA